MAWIEDDGSGNDLVKAKRWKSTGTPSLQVIAPTAGLNYSAATDASDVKLFHGMIDSQAVIFATWIEGGKVRVKSFDNASGNDASTSWTFKDGGEAGGLNVDSSYNASKVFVSKAGVAWSHTYITWLEENASNVKQVRVKRLTHSIGAWTLVDNGGLNIDLRKMPRQWVGRCTVPPMSYVYIGLKVMERLIRYSRNPCPSQSKVSILSLT